MANKYFNYENYKTLISTLTSEKNVADAKAHMAFSTIEDSMNSFNDYVNCVNHCEVKIALAYATYEGQELRDYVTDLDQRRRRHHECAISSTSICNRIAGMYGVDNIFEGDVNDRFQVADFCLEVVNDLFTNRKM